MFRHFSAKREVSFYGQDRFVQTFPDGLSSAPPDAAFRFSSRTQNDLQTRRITVG